MRKLMLISVASCVLVACDCGNPNGNDGGNDGGSGGGNGGSGGAGGGTASTGGGAGGGAGGAGGGGATACIPGATAITVTPANSTVTVGNPPAPVTFTATATVNGTPTDVTSQVSWSATRTDATPPGTFTAPGVYAPTPGAGGVITITATDGCVSGFTTLTVKLDVVFKDPGPTITNRFNGTVVTNNASKTPSIVYPSDQTRFPRNIYKVLFQWAKGGNDYFRLTFDGPNAKTVVYTDGVHVTCQAAATSACFEADTNIWLAIAGSNAGLTTTLTIDGVTTNDTNVYRSAAITIGFSRRDVTGAIFYWSTTAAGVRRATVSDFNPDDYVVAKPVATVLPNNNGAVKCVACHTVSRSGKRMFAFTQANASGGFVYEVTPQSPPIPLLTTQITTAKGFGTFRPDDARVVATVGNAMQEWDIDAGVRVAILPVAEGTNPDWSPTGTELAYSDQGGDSPAGANLKAISYTDGGWGAVRQLVAAAGFTNLYPSYSPSGDYVAYARGKGGHGDKTLQLWLAKTDGTVPPVELATANRIVNSATTLGQHENNMPTWAPPGDLLWVAFNSVRAYGVVFPAGGTQQIWVTAIDPAKLGQRLPDGGVVDPSFPAFRFPFQGLAENNHRAYWTLDVRDPPDGGAPVCVALGNACGTGFNCCVGLSCTPGPDGGISTCQTPNDGGVCIAGGQPCDQTSGAQCCTGYVCDQATADAGYTCNPLIN
jgi:hypothetical protein